MMLAALSGPEVVWKWNEMKWKNVLPSDKSTVKTLFVGPGYLTILQAEEERDHSAY